MIMKNVKFKIIHPDRGTDLQEYECKDNAFVQEFTALVACEYTLDGDVALHYNGKKIYQPTLPLFKLIDAESGKLEVWVDPSKSVAQGGVARGASATQVAGVRGIARGGYGGGGQVSGSAIQGGGALGGNAEGRQGNGGQAFGGHANATEDGLEANGGTGVGGSMAYVHL
ncbi:uncharacterized protein FTJAE_9083 [Fusarium tjaetaba]|uniref:Uncharacterized protein n=1 Tax=Fusarium tjaetaba TaxID=1567544 RepID=A0A8H5VMI7_9HYPO|nr:uncharacterized protein FTJAE_9083 [Fusarium tjaetaba]KAF5627815.1 hypothetical protein FTJAE_9083 [Fusarium tjaetaba]